MCWSLVHRASLGYHIQQLCKSNTKYSSKLLFHSIKTYDFCFITDWSQTLRIILTSLTSMMSFSKFFVTYTVQIKASLVTQEVLQLTGNLSCLVMQGIYKHSIKYSKNLFKADWFLEVCIDLLDRTKIQLDQTLIYIWSFLLGIKWFVLTKKDS